MKKNFAIRKVYITFFSFGVLLLQSLISISQPAYNANSKVPSYTHPFSYGINMGYFPNWTREQLADIAAGNSSKGVKGAGVNALRPLMREEHFDVYGYEHLVEDFNHYKSLGIENNTVFLGYPASKNVDNTSYGGCSETSKLFVNMYEPIWDSGQNGTPVNEDNSYALHVYKAVTTYKDWVKIWEIVNEPDYTSSSLGWRGPGEAGNWWENDPSPCDLTNLKAPIFSYIRMLRISYEVIKHIDPTAFVAVGGVGYESFLDAILRNTDNPDGGKVTASYPNMGGAYFDVLSYHCYPQFKLSQWDNSVGAMVYTRHSDAAADVLTNQQDTYQEVLSKYGYNGNEHPKKHFIITETNVPRKNIGDVIAGDQVQVNFIIKAIVNTQQKGLKQLHLFNLGDTKDFSEATSAFELMGLYKNLNKAVPFNQQYNDIGIAYKTTSDLLGPLKFNQSLTKKLRLPSNIGGGVFTKGKTYRVVLWAKTNKDNSELANATFSFPSQINISNLVKREWDYAVTNREVNISPSKVALTGNPIFLDVELGSTKMEADDREILAFPNPSFDELNIVSSTKANILKVEVIDHYGRTVQSYNFDRKFPRNEIKFNVSTLEDGIYTVIVDTDKGQKVIKVVKK